VVLGDEDLPGRGAVTRLMPSPWVSPDFPDAETCWVDFPRCRAVSAQVHAIATQHQQTQGCAKSNSRRRYHTFLRPALTLRAAFRMGPTNIRPRPVEGEFSR
jgi:hypothetical protein